MGEKSTAGRPRPLSTTSHIGDDPDAGQVIEPDGESPEDPVAKQLYRGCLTMLLVIGVGLGIAVVLYRIYVAA